MAKDTIATTLPDVPVEALLFFVGVKRFNPCDRPVCMRQVRLASRQFPEMAHQAVMQGHRQTTQEKFNSWTRRNCNRGDFADRRY